MKQPTLRPSDIVVACQLALAPQAHFLELASATGLSAGECHNAVRRLRFARLVLAGERRPSITVLHQFLVSGAPFAFPPVIGADVVGVPTAHSAPAFNGLVDSADGFVWAHDQGTARGKALLPLFPGAHDLRTQNPPLYDLLTIVDALRVGSARVRKLASELLAKRLEGGA